MILVSLFILANLVPQNVIAVTIATCEDADPGACEDMAIVNPNMCQETILSTKVCPKHCNKCPLVCYSGETSIDPTTNLIDFRQSNTVSCNAGQICKLSPHGTVLGSYMAECGDQQQCTNADICCNSNLCNTPKALTTLPPPTTTPKPTTTTVKQGSTTANPGTSSFIDPTDCFYESTLYEGRYSTTMFGKPCINWNDVKHGLPGLENAGNKCSDPTGRGHPWCFVSTSMDSEFCAVPFCEACYFPGQTIKYTGYHSKDINGQTCLPWTTYAQQMPELELKNSSFPDGSLEAASNYCRDLNGAGVIFCFTGTRLSPCNVPVCDHECWDNPQSNTDCNLVERFICNNDYLSLTQCAKTCNRCNFGLLPKVTVIPEVTCRDEPKANCPALELVICPDYNASMLLCPKTCRRCDDMYPFTAAPTMTTPGITTSMMSTMDTTLMTSPMNTTIMTSPMTSMQPSTVTPKITSSVSVSGTTASVPEVTTAPIAVWAEWGSWGCRMQDGCFNVRFRNCETSNSSYTCPGNGYEILPCVNNVCGVPGECKDFTNDIGENGCQAINLPIICPVVKLAWRTCRKSCNMCDECFDYLNCSSQGAQDFFCQNPMYAVQYCRKTCGLCKQNPVDIHLSKCDDPVASDSICEELQKQICICKNNDINALCSNYCANKCAPDYPLTDQLRNCTPPTKDGVI